MSVLFLVLLCAHVVYDAARHWREDAADAEHESCLADFLFVLLLGTAAASKIGDKIGKIRDSHPFSPEKDENRWLSLIVPNWQRATDNGQRLLAGLVQVIVIVLALVLAFQGGIFSRDLLSPVFIGAGLVAGHVIFVLSLLITHGSARDAVAHLIDGGVNRYAADKPAVLSRFASVGFVEELTYRAVAQPLLIAFTGNAALGIAVVALLFSLSHRHFLKRPSLVSAEFLLFSLLLGWLYYVTGSLILVMVIHAVRDIEIAYLDHHIMLERLRGEWNGFMAVLILGLDWVDGNRT